ncbi:MAG TPA: M4 family metallopeptidase [Pyrinomonadaceae bacterium]|nr:M4 family metallopeptidase [Pyrinomonadaceae bacterium]
MKKFLSILAVFGIAVFAFGLIIKKTDASRPVFNAGTQDELENAKQISLDILRGRAAQRAIGNVDEFQVQKVEIDDLKMAHTRVRQSFGGVPVWEGEAIVHLKQDGSLSTVTDDLKESVAVNTQPNLSDKEAINLVLDSYRGRAKLTEDPTADLWIYRGEDRDHLVYRVTTPRVDGSRETSVPVTFIDAQTGEKVFGYDNLQTGTGSSLYSGTVSINTSSVGSTFYMEDLTRKQGTFNMNSTGNESTGTGGTQSRYTDTDDVWNTTIQRAGVDAHYGAAKTFDYYLNVHGRNGIDGSGGPGTTTSAATGVGLIVSRVHFGSSGRYNNAFWYNNQMSYGDGDGTTFSPLTTIDICGHEMTHGVTERTANLTYSGESGALNESMSDVMGAMVELYSDGGTVTADTWKIGEDAYTPGTSGDALRRMDNPNSVGDPDHYSLRLYQGACTPSSSNDNCGVHTNSSITNHAYYLIANGGTNRVSGISVSGIGTTDAARIWYRALTSYMTSSTNFSGARTATLNAATAIFGSTSTQYNSVAQGWCAVGVGTCPGGGTPTPTPTPTPGGNLLVNGGFEGSASPWVGSGTGYFYVNPGNYPHGGTGYIYFGVNNSVSGQSYQQVSIPSTATGTLSFWLNVTSSETTTTTQYDKLFVEVRNTSGTLLATLATYSNLNKGTAGVYSQKSFNVAAYKGQTVRIQFRSTTDSSVTTTFRVDDASLQ